MEMTTEWICLAAGPVVAGLVQVLKTSALVARYPKVWALGLAGVTAVVSGLTVGSFDWQAIATCTLIPFAGAVATFEVAKTTTEAL